MAKAVASISHDVEKQGLLKLKQIDQFVNFIRNFKSYLCSFLLSSQSGFSRKTVEYFSTKKDHRPRDDGHSFDNRQC